MTARVWRAELDEAEFLLGAPHEGGPPGAIALYEAAGFRSGDGEPGRRGLFYRRHLPAPD